MLRITRITRVSLLLSFFALAAARGAPAQNLADQILVRFPSETVRIEYARSAELRRLPEYGELRTRFLGPRLKAMDAALAGLGIVDADIQEMAIGWRAQEQADAPDRAEEKALEASSQMDAALGGAQPKEWPMAIFGLLYGRFDAERIGENVVAQRIPRVPIGDREAYCTRGKVAEACLMLLDGSQAAFGDRASLQGLLEVQEGRRSSLGADRRFTRLLHVANRNAAIWGIATGPSIADGLLAWTPGREQMQVPWNKLFERVEAMTYRVEAGDRMTVAIRLECDSPESARLMSALLHGLQGLQAMLWKVQAPGGTNLLAAMEISSDYKVCLLRLVTTSRTLVESAFFQGSGTAH